MHRNQSYYAVKITADKRTCEEICKGNVTMRYSKKCRSCKRHRERLKETSKYKRQTESFRSYKTKYKSFSRQNNIKSTTKEHEARFTLTSPIEWETSPLSSVSIIPTPTKPSKTSKFTMGNIENVDIENLENPRSPFVTTKSFEDSFIINFDKSFGKQQPTLAENDAFKFSSQLVCCRYCLSNDTKKHGNLISPCLCAGSSKYVHKSCLEKWLTLRNISECEVCKTQYKTKWIHRPLCSLHFPAIGKKDVLLHFLAVSLFVSLIFQFLGLIYVSMVPRSLPRVQRTITLIGLSFGLFWFMIGCIVMSIVLHTSPYWHKFRNMNKRKVILLTTNNNITESDNESDNEFIPLANSSRLSIQKAPMKARVAEIDFTRPVPV